MKKVSSSPDRNTFQMENYIKRREEQGKLPEPAYLEMYKSWREQDAINLANTDWQKDNMEYDLRSTEWILEKVRAKESYAQNLYAAMCNNDFQKLDVMPILKDQRWSCSWRHAGGIIADMREQGDYIDWYCSGIGNDERGYGLDNRDGGSYVAESVVTDEIREDLKQLGWIVVDQNDEF